MSSSPAGKLVERLPKIRRDAPRRLGRQSLPDDRVIRVDLVVVPGATAEFMVPDCERDGEQASVAAGLVRLFLASPLASLSAVPVMSWVRRSPRVVTENTTGGNITGVLTLRWHAHVTSVMFYFDDKYQVS